MRIKKMLLWVGIAILTITAIGIYIATHSARENFSYSIRAIPQNALNWVNSKTENIPLLTVQKQQALTAQYLAHYFSPWQPNFPTTFPYLKKELHYTADSYQRYPGYGINHLPNASKWIQAIAHNMAMAQFPNAHIRVITLARVNLRNLPTNQPSFGDFHEAGQGYPFDNLEVSSVAANTPAIIIQKSRDGAWCFIITSNIEGWVPTPTLAVVDDHFIQQWETGRYVALIKNAVPIADETGLVRFTADIGKIFPLAMRKKGVSSYRFLMAVSDANQHAVIKTGKLNASFATAWPMLSTPHNIASVMNAMLGMKYGWGGIDGDSDCSLTAMNLFSTFGIWLPRNSALQAAIGRSVDLQRLSSRKKEKAIIEKGVPFLSLLYIPTPGHIMVYLGEKKGRAYIFQAVWGLETRSFLGRPGRAIIGSTVITPVDLGKSEINVPKTLLDQVGRLVVLG